MKLTAEGLIKENDDLNKQKTKNSEKYQQNIVEKFKLQEKKSRLLNENQVLEDDCLKLEENWKESATIVETLGQKIKEVDGRISSAKLKTADLKEKSKELNEKVDNSTAEMEMELEVAKRLQTEEVSELGSELKTEYENRMKNALASLRDVYEGQLAKDKEGYKEKYETKIRKLQSGLSKEKGKHNTNLEENDENLEKIKKLISKIEDLQENLGSLSEKEVDLQNKIDESNAEHDKKVILLLVMLLLHFYTVYFTPRYLINKMR